MSSGHNDDDDDLPKEEIMTSENPKASKEDTNAGQLCNNNNKDKEEEPETLDHTATPNEEDGKPTANTSEKDDGDDSNSEASKEKEDFNAKTDAEENDVDSSPDDLGDTTITTPLKKENSDDNDDHDEDEPETLDTTQTATTTTTKEQEQEDDRPAETIMTTATSETKDNDDSEPQQAPNDNKKEDGNDDAENHFGLDEIDALAADIQTAADEKAAKQQQRQGDKDGDDNDSAIANKSGDNESENQPAAATTKKAGWFSWSGGAKPETPNVNEKDKAAAGDDDDKVKVDDKHSDTIDDNNNKNDGAAAAAAAKDEKETAEQEKAKAAAKKKSSGSWSLWGANQTSTTTNNNNKDTTDKSLPSTEESATEKDSAAPTTTGAEDSTTTRTMGTAATDNDDGEGESKKQPAAVVAPKKSVWFAGWGGSGKKTSSADDVHPKEKDFDMAENGGDVRKVVEGDEDPSENAIEEGDEDNASAYEENPRRSAPVAAAAQPDFMANIDQNDDEVRLAMEMALAAMKNPKMSPAEIRRKVLQEQHAEKHSEFVKQVEEKKAAKAKAEKEEAEKRWKEQQEYVYAWFSSGAQALSKTVEEYNWVEAKIKYAEKIKADKQVRATRRAIKAKKKQLKAVRLQGNRVETRHIFKRQRMEKHLIEVTAQVEKYRHQFCETNYNATAYAKAMMKAAKKWKKPCQDDHELALEAQLCRNMHQMLALEKQKSKLKKQSKEIKKYLQRCKSWLTDKQALCELHMLTLDSTHTSMMNIYQDLLNKHDKFIQKLLADEENGLAEETLSQLVASTPDDITQKYDQIPRHAGPGATLNALRGLPFKDSIYLKSGSLAGDEDNDDGKDKDKDKHHPEDGMDGGGREQTKVLIEGVPPPSSPAAGDHNELYIQTMDDGASINSALTDPDDEVTGFVTTVPMTDADSVSGNIAFGEDAPWLGDDEEMGKDGGGDDDDDDDEEAEKKKKKKEKRDKEKKDKEKEKKTSSSYKDKDKKKNGESAPPSSDGHKKIRSSSPKDGDSHRRKVDENQVEAAAAAAATPTTTTKEDDPAAAGGDE